MIGRTNTGGGGGGVGGAELVIVGGTTSPEKANHNTIWINTPNTITSIVLSATEPESPIEGMAWVVIGDSSGVEVTANIGGDWITVYLVSVKQYISGVWNSITAMVYKDGEWVQFSSTWNGELYDNGDQYEQRTGGWKKVRPSNGALDATFDATQITVAKVGNSGYDLALYTNNKIDVTGYSKLYVEIELAFPVSFANQGCRVGLVDTNTEQYPENTMVAITRCTTVGASTVEVIVPPSGGEYYVALQFSVATGAVKKVYLSR